ncbi:hypothetical protein AX16_010281 [Volvariella volvacea WC 439]|nr:hypothetical protein AX16_010281 [Volvariella volvacea WC 439]
MSPKLKGTDLIHGDNGLFSRSEVAPSISVTTTFRQPKPDSSNSKPLSQTEVDFRNPERHVYSRYTQEISTRAEHILSRISDGFALTYSSGLAASYAALVFFNPKRVAITGGYHGCHATIEVFKKTRGVDIEVIGLDDEYRPGDLCWLETPVNPTGESRDIRYYAEKIHKVGGKLLVDSTFGPPPLQHPFKFGADCILHSATKYFGGHSDLLGGILIVKTESEWKVLQHDRTYMGNNLGSLEAWLLLRSLRTLHLRVPHQAATATALAQWLDAIAKTPAGQYYDGIPGGVIAKVWHSSLQPASPNGFNPKTQMEGGWNATFAILLDKPEHALHLPHLLQYFVPATSLGGVESLIEHRVQSDPTADPRLVRLSIGVEDFEDLKADLRHALAKLVQERSKL